MAASSSNIGGSCSSSDDDDEATGDNQGQQQGRQQQQRQRLPWQEGDFGAQASWQQMLALAREFGWQEVVISDWQRSRQAGSIHLLYFAMAMLWQALLLPGSTDAVAGSRHQ